MRAVIERMPLAGGGQVEPGHPTLSFSTKPRTSPCSTVD